MGTGLISPVNHIKHFSSEEFHSVFNEMIRTCANDFYAAQFEIISQFLSSNSPNQSPT